MSVKTNKGAAGTGRGLGRGFGSLLPQDFDQSMLLDKHDRIQKIELGNVKPDPGQPRRIFEEGPINELAESIKRYGILQPIVVTQRNDTYYIVAGERRFRAAKKAGLARVPVLVRTLEELEKLEISLVENVQRVDLNPVEQAVSIVRLHEQFNVSYHEVAKRLGKAHTTIINIVRLLQLPDFVLNALSHGKISEGHARSLLALKDESLQRTLLVNIEQKGWSVRKAEQFASQNKGVKAVKKPTGPASSLNLNERLSKNLSTKWGIKAGISARARGGGKITLDFATREKLDSFLEFLEKNS